MPKKTFPAPPTVPPPTAVVAEAELPEPLEALPEPVAVEPVAVEPDAIEDDSTDAAATEAPAEAPAPALVFPNLRIINRLAATSAFQTTLALIQAKTPQAVQSQLVNVGLRVSTPLLPVLQKFDKELKQFDDVAVGALDTLETVVRRGQEALHTSTTAAVDYVLPETAVPAPETSDGTEADVEEKQSDAAIARITRRLKNRRDAQFARISHLNQLARQNVDASVSFVYQHANRQALLDDAVLLRQRTQGLVQTVCTSAEAVFHRVPFVHTAAPAAEHKADTAAPAAKPLFPSTLTPAALAQLWLNAATSVSTATQNQALRTAKTLRTVVTSAVLPPAEGQEDKRYAVAKTAEGIVHRVIAVPVVQKTSHQALALLTAVYGRVTPLVPTALQPHVLLHALDEATKDVTA
eukprot:TRINITY_DN20447_c0_g1_i1.p1 TRINITY_DN20447_c0_g1~~TRINITY_DN20447_c0_g1_i1.p1  ORF type:complete len:418 (+),score=117.04 TRINITY_DN20447_c0_g1_i1:31-1254(+)